MLRSIRLRVFICCLLLTVACLIFWYMYRQSTLFILHSPSNLYNDSQRASKPKREYSIPLDFIPIDSKAKKVLADSFQPFYVVKDTLTDCSFTSAFMLLYQRDPDFPYRILKTGDANDYSLFLPGINHSAQVSGEELKQYYDAINKKRTGLQKVIKGYSPRGFDIMRCAYYKYQRKAHMRKEQKLVYGGGWPDRDLMILSGVKTGTRIEQNSEGYFSLQVRIELQKGIFNERIIPNPTILTNPLASCNSLDDYLVIAATNRKGNGLLGNRLVPNHAYYLIERLDNNEYLFGNPYQTRRPVIITEKELVNRFCTIYLIPKALGSS